MPKAERGASLIEFAFVLPVFLMLIVGILYYGIGFATQQAVNHAAGRAADAAVAVDPALDSSAFRARAIEQAEPRIAGILAYFPGGTGERFVLSGGCDTAADSGAADQSSLCVGPDADRPGRRVVTVNLAPRFQSLWPGFPETGLIPTPEFVRATGTAVVAASPADDGAG